MNHQEKHGTRGRKYCGRSKAPFRHLDDDLSRAAVVVVHLVRVRVVDELRNFVVGCIMVTAQDRQRAGFVCEVVVVWSRSMV